MVSLIGRKSILRQTNADNCSHGKIAPTILGTFDRGFHDWAKLHFQAAKMKP